MGSRGGAVSWNVVVPVKRSAAAKSRLAPLAGERREQLARALALDTLAAAAGCPGVRLVVVSADPSIALEAVRMGALTVADDRQGLGAAVAIGIRAAIDPPIGAPRQEHPGERHPQATAVLLGDLPALRPHDLEAALRACAAAGCAFVPDARGSGTVLLAALEPADLRPAFGPGSAAAHARHATRLDLDLPRLRRDVDVAADLEEALTLGVGRRTAALLAAMPDLTELFIAARRSSSLRVPRPNESGPGATDWACSTTGAGPPGR